MSEPDRTPAPLKLLECLQTIFPTFGDGELLAEIETGDVELHGVMRRFTEYFATQWLWTYNNERPNMGIGGVTPAQKLKIAA
ncbi:hypothetical protein FHS76_004389 [Ochrobactrum daejeonense]|uniref:Integrase catalytic domain-containing protein n=1 Tax=Brucella daejeonensis TaxID=659015 RepID=A0A7W9B1H0_9HYPH|nr:hypothetical protein [Brucella daejeonensis]MBB5704471.1 hypothetical protein [Brucella daejeonensis]